MGGGRADRRLAVAIAVAGPLLLATGVAAEDIEPKALPDRIEDVPATRPDPFPAFANFAWRAFVALAWPARTDPERRGQPDRSKRLGDPGPRVWETFKSRFEVFQRGPDGGASTPARWASYGGANPCGAAAENRVKTLAAFDAFADFNQASFTPGRFEGPLVAQNRTYTRYEVRFNQAAFDSIVGHEWYRRDHLPTPEQPGQFDVGSISVKAAWRLLTEADTPAVRGRYYVVHDAEVVDVAGSLDAGKTVCAKRDIALVGLHIAVKTLYRPQWLWSSFEHVDNVPPIGLKEAREPDARAASAPYSYNDPGREQALTPPPPEARAARPVSWDNPPERDPDPTQVVRTHPINGEIMAINQAYWSLPEVRDTVWSHYMLVATQWPTVTQPVGPQNDGRFFPGLPVEPNTPVEPYQTAGGGEARDNLANTTMETFAQAPPASCMACHHVVSNALGRDFGAVMESDAR